MDAALAFAALLAFFFGVKYLVEKKKEGRRAMIHKERILAMEKGIPLPEFPPEEEPSSKSLLASPSVRSVLPRVALGCGIIVLFFGFGLLVALMINRDPEVHQAWTFSFIPIMLGFGVLLYYFLIRRLDSNVK